MGRKRETDAAGAEVKKVEGEMADFNKRIQHYIALNKKVTDNTEKEKNYSAISDLRDKYSKAKAALTAKRTFRDGIQSRQAEEMASEKANDERDAKEKKA